MSVRSGAILQTTPLDNEAGNWRLVGKEIAICVSQDRQIVGCTYDGFRDLILGQKVGAADAMITNGTARIAISPGYRTRPLIFDTASNPQPIQVGPEPFVSCSQMRWSPQGRYIAVVGKGLESDDGKRGYDGWLHLIDASDGKLLNRVKVGSTRLTASSVAWSPDEEVLVAGGSDGFCAVYERMPLRPLVSKAKHRASVRSLDFHPDGRRIASAGDDQSVLVWDAASGETLLSFSVGASVKHVAWSPDGTKLAALTSAEKLYVWDSNSGHEFSQSSGFLSRIERIMQAELKEAAYAQDWSAAAQAADQWIAVVQHDLFYVFYVATLTHAMNNDGPAAHRAVQEMFERLIDSDDPHTLHFTSWSASLMPDLMEDFAIAINHARQAVKKRPDKLMYLVGMGAILMRAGQHEEARSWFERAESSKEQKSPYLPFLRAINRWHSGDVEVASEYLSKGEAMAKQELASSSAWNRELTIRLLRNEARQLIKSKK